MQEYSLKFSHFSMYSPTMEDNPWPRMNYFVMGVSRFVETDFCTTILLNDMDISTLMVYAYEESKLRDMTRDGKRPRMDEPRQPKPNKRLYHQESSMSEQG